MQHAQDLVFAIIDAHQRALPAADLFAIAQRALDACAAAERERMERAALALVAECEIGHAPFWSALLAAIRRSA